MRVDKRIVAMKRIRLLHTADIHLERSHEFLRCPARVGAQLRDAQRSVFAHIVEVARQWPADVLLIAGDLFDAIDVPGSAIAFVRDKLEQVAPIRVYIAPGNRDPYTETSPYATELWPDNVTVFKPGAWQADEHPALPITVHGIGCDGVDDSGAWFNDLHIEGDGRIHIAVAHGTERTHKPDSAKTFAPFDAADIAREHLAYLALGHFHAMTEVAVEGPALMRYPGAPKRLGFDEAEDNGLIKLEIDGDNGNVVSLDIDASLPPGIAFETHDILCTRNTAPDDIRKAVPDYNFSCVARMRMTGDAPVPIQEAVAACRDAARRRCLFTDIVNDLTPAAQTPALTRDNSCAARFFALMRERIKDAHDREAAMCEAYARDLAVCACRNVELPPPSGFEVWP